MVITTTDSVKEKNEQPVLSSNESSLPNLEKRNHYSNNEGKGGGGVTSARTTILRLTNRETNSVNIINH